MSWRDTYEKKYKAEAPKTEAVTGSTAKSGWRQSYENKYGGNSSVLDEEQRNTLNGIVDRYKKATGNLRVRDRKKWRTDAQDYYDKTSKSVEEAKEVYQELMDFLNDNKSRFTTKYYNDIAGEGKWLDDILEAAKAEVDFYGSFADENAFNAHLRYNELSNAVRAEGEKGDLSALRDSYGKEAEELEKEYKRLERQYNISNLVTGTNYNVQVVTNADPAVNEGLSEQMGELRRQIADAKTKQGIAEELMLENAKKSGGVEKGKELAGSVQDYSDAWALNSPNLYTPDTVGGALGMMFEGYRNDRSNEGPKDNWNDEQRDEYYARYSTFGEENAKQYAIQLNNALGKGQYEDRIKGATEWGGGGKTGIGKAWRGAVGVASAVATMPENAAKWVDKITQVAARGYYVNPGIATPVDYSNAIVKGKTEQLNKYGTITESAPIVGGKGLGELYQLGISVAQSAAYGNALGEAKTLALFFGSAANSAFDEAIDKGASAQQAALYSTISGANEVIGEKFSLEALLNPEKMLSWGVFKSAALLGGIEGGEELLTTSLNTIADVLVNKDKSELYSDIYARMEAGEDYDSAVRGAWLEWANNAAYDFVGGVISGGLHTGTQKITFKNAAYDGKNGLQPAYGADARQIAQEGVDVGAAGASQLQQRVNRGKKVRNKDVLPVVQSTNRAAMVTATEEQIKKRYPEVEDARKLANALVGEARGDRLSDGQKRAIKNAGEIAEVIVEELKEDNPPQWVSTIGVRGEDSLQYGNKDVVEPQKQFNEAMLRYMYGNESVDTQVLRREQGTITGYTQNADGVDVFTVTREGGTQKDYSAEELGLSGKELSAVKDAATAKLLTAEQREANVVRGQQSVMSGLFGRDSYASFDEAWSAFKSQVPYSITREQAKEAWLQSSKSQKKLRSTMNRKGSGKVTSESVTIDGVEYQKVSEEKWREFKKTARFKEISALAKNIGTFDVVFFENKVVDGKLKGINGYYKGGTIYLSINASATTDVSTATENYIMLTAAHELTHFLKEANPEAYRQLKDFVQTELVKKGILGNGLTFAQLVMKKQAEYSMDGKQISVEDAMEEVVADGCEMMLKDNKRLALFNAKHEESGRRVLHWLREFLGRIKEATFGNSSWHTESKELEKSFAKMQKMWTEGLIDTTKTADSTGWRYDSSVMYDENDISDIKTVEDGRSSRRDADLFQDPADLRLYANLLEDAGNALDRENRALRKSLEYWKKQTKRTKEKTISSKDMNALANRLRKDIGSDADKDSIVRMLTELGNYIVRTEKDKLHFNDIKQRARDIARLLMDNVTEKSEHYLMALTDEGYKNLEIEHCAADIIDTLMSEDVGLEAPTYADRADERLKTQREKDAARLEKYKAEAKARMNELRRASKARLEKQKTATANAKAARDKAREAKKKTVAYYKDRMSREKERRTKTELRADIKKLYNEISTRTVNPKDGKYIPQNLLSDVADILKFIDLDSGKSEELHKKIVTLNEKYTALSEGKSQYRDATDSTVAALLNELQLNLSAQSGNIYDMSVEDLTLVYNTLRAVDHTARNAVKLVGMEESKNAYEMSKAMTNEVKAVKDSSDRLIPNLLQKLRDAMLTPERFFSMMGGWRKGSTWEQMGDMLNKAQLKQTQIKMEAARIFEDLMADQESFDAMTDPKNLIDVGLVDENGESVLITMDMALKIYLESMNEDNARHIMYGGYTAPNVEKYYKGKISEAYAKGRRSVRGYGAELAELAYRLSKAEDKGTKKQIQAELDEVKGQAEAWLARIRQNIYEQMGDYERTFVETAQFFFNDFSKNYLNETTLAVYGFEKATVDDYIPIHTDAAYRETSFESIVRDFSIENAGFMQSRTGASNPVLLEGLADVIARQIDNVADYSAIMPAVRNFGKVWNKGTVGYQESLKNTVLKKYGTSATKYIENIIADLQGARRGSSDGFAAAMNWLRGNLARAALTVSPRVALAQTASYPTAAAVTGWGPLLKAFADVGENPMYDVEAREQLAKYSPLMWYRMQGFFDTEVGDLRKNKDVVSKTMDKMKFLTSWIEVMDGMTVGKLWKAAQYYVDEHFDLERDTEDFYKKSAEIFNEIVEKTQPNYTTFQRPDILRTPNSVLKLFTSFMTQRLQNANIIMESVGRYNAYVQYAREGTISQDELQQARLDLTRAVSSQVVATVTLVAFKFFADLLLHNLRKYKDDDDEITPQSVTLKLVDMFAESIFSNFLWGGELHSAIISAATGERYYGISLSGLDSFTDTVSAAVDFTQEPDKDKLWKLVKSGAQMCGVPLTNTANIVSGVKKWYMDISTGTPVWESTAEDELTADSQRKRYYDAVISGDGERAERYGYDTQSEREKNLAKEIKRRYSEGELDYDTALEQLRSMGGMNNYESSKTMNELQMEVETGIKYSKLKDSFISGDVDFDTAAEYLVTYGGKETDEAEDTVNQWRLEIDKNMIYGDLNDYYLAGDVTQEEVIEYLREYGGLEAEDAKAKAKQWQMEYDTGIPYDKMSRAFNDGEISKDDVVDYYQDYGSYDLEKALAKADKMDFVGEDESLKDVSESAATKYYGYKLESVDKALYLEMWQKLHAIRADKNSDGKSISGTALKKKLAYIDGFKLTAYQKTAIALAVGITEAQLKKYEAAWM